jgi:hypothetical protein
MAGTIAWLEKIAASDLERDLLDKMARGVLNWLTLYDQYVKLAWAHQFSDAHEVVVGKIYPLVEGARGPLPSR